MNLALTAVADERNVARKAMGIPPLIRPPYFFQTPTTPDLGCHVREEHAFQVDRPFPCWNEYAPYDANGNVRPHQACFRVKCARAAFHQRVKVWRRDFDGDVHSGSNPDWVLGGGFRPYPSNWIKYPPQAMGTPYWFRGEYRDPSQPD